MARPGLEREIIDATAYQRTLGRFREANIVLPTFAQLADPARIPAAVSGQLSSIDPDAAHPLNLQGSGSLRRVFILCGTPTRFRGVRSGSAAGAPDDAPSPRELD